MIWGEKQNTGLKLYNLDSAAVDPLVANNMQYHAPLSPNETKPENSC